MRRNREDATGMILLNTEEELLQYIECVEGVYIYGAGRTARTLLKRLKRYDIGWENIVTTNGGEMLDGKIAVRFHDKSMILQRSDALTIVAVREQFHKEIEENLSEKAGIKAVYLSDKLIHKMEAINGLHFKFQTHIVEHCNLKCRGCYHFSSLAKEEYLSIEEYEKDIQRLGELFCGSMDEILLLGGEPLLHPQITEFFRLSRRHMPNCELKILTNGLKLCNMNNDFWRSVYEHSVQVWVTKYPVDFDYQKAERIAKEHGSKLFYFNQEPVRTLGHQPINLEGNKDYIKNWKNCYRANECVDLKHGKIFPCIIPAEIKPFNEYFEQNLQVCREDYVDIYEVETAMELLEKLERPIPFCRYCNRDSISVFGCRPWSQTSYDMKEWIE